MVLGPLLSNSRQRVGAFLNANVSNKTRNAGTACVLECVLKTLACLGLRVGRSKFSNRALAEAFSG